jgi:ATP-binding cassette subfamily F protein 3
MLSLVGISNAYGPQVVLDRADWTVLAGERVGLAGANGAGKSTLLRIVAGRVEPDRGEVCLKKGSTVGYLPQEIVGMSGESVVSTALSAFDEIHALEARCRDLERRLERCDPSSAEHDRLMAEYSAATEEWEHRGAYDLESRAEDVLGGLGFRSADFSRDVGEFSGGWQMRVALAKLLLQRPDVLLLDEPTNHLDLEARNWLEEFLGAYPGAVVLVAHDRYFLDVTVTRITEVESGRLTDYACSFTRYEEEKGERLEQARRAYEQQQEEIERTEAFIRRFRYQASKAKLVQSRVKQLEKIERLPPPPGAAAKLHFRMPPSRRSGRTVLELARVSKRYGEIIVYDGLDLSIERGERIALVGPNGAGKTTLVKLLAAVETPTEGERRVGHQVEVGYFAQDQTGVLDPQRTVLQEMMADAPFEMVPHLRDLLGAFLFSGDAVHKPTEVLSGGERNRLALAKLLLRPVNCLLLDEPTNHLDIHAKDVLLEALQNFAGTVVLVSHDRYILDALPGCIVEVGHRRAVRYLGNYEDYLRKKAAEEAVAAATERPIPAATARAPVVKPPRASKASGNEKPARAAKRAGDDPSRLTEEIARFEEEQAKLSEELSKPDFYMSHPDPNGLIARYTALKERIAEMYARLDRALAG